MFKRKPAAATEDAGTRWQTQLRKGSLEMCLLAILATRPRYGFEILQGLADHPELAIAEGTLYPLLNRLQADGLIEGTWQPSDQGPPRKYYAPTAEGHAALARMREAWAAHTRAVAAVLTTSLPAP